MDALLRRFAKTSPDNSAKSRSAQPNPQTSTTINFKTEDTQVKKALVICLALVVLASLTALAQNNPKSVIAINGGRTTVQMKSHAPNHAIPQACKPGKFYDNICNGTINQDEGYTISDGSPIDTEYTPAGQITSLKSGVVTKIGVEVGFVEGTNGAIVDLDKDCSNMPCGNPDGSKHLCQGKIKNLFTFGDAPTIEYLKCPKTTKLVKGKAYWVYVQSDANSWLAWDLSVATGGSVEGTNDVWGTYYSGEPVGALAIY